MTYENPVPVAVAVVPVRLNNGDLALLGVDRNIGILGLAFPGGYVDKLESFEKAVARELLEETGYFTKPEDWRIVSSACAQNNRVLVFCVMNHEISENLIPTLKFDPVEVKGLVIIDSNTELVFGLHQEVARKFLGESLKQAA